MFSSVNDTLSALGTHDPQDLELERFTRRAQREVIHVARRAGGEPWRPQPELRISPDVFAALLATGASEDTQLPGFDRACYAQA